MRTRRSGSASGAIQAGGRGPRWRSSSFWQETETWEINDDSFYEIFEKKGIKDSEDTYNKIKNIINFENEEEKEVDVVDEENEMNIRNKIFKKMKKKK